MAKSIRTSMGSFRSTPSVSSSGVVGNSVTILGVPEAIAKLNLIGAYVARDLGLITYNAARNIRMRAQELVHSSSHPYNDEYEYTDSLKNGIQEQKSGIYAWVVSASSVAGGADHEYADFEEMGTSQNPAHPYLRPAAYEEGPKVKIAVAALAAKLEAM